MSSSPISRSPDLQALEEAGYQVTIRGEYLVVSRVPYVTERGDVAAADLVMHLALDPATGLTIRPPDHTVWWTGATPYTGAGDSMRDYLCCSRWETGRDIGEGITVYQQWSRKLRGQNGPRAYLSYEEKVITYMDEVASQAEARKPGIRAALATSESMDVETAVSRFAYVDPNPYRNGTRGIEQRIEDEIVAVIGVGGTGSYLVDILAKTNISELHLFDDDIVDVPNAFRIAGAVRVGELGGATRKVHWHKRRYGVVRTEGLHVHDIQITPENTAFLEPCTTVFIAVDDLSTRRMLQGICQRMGKRHFAVGIGLEIEGERNDQIGGMVKVEKNYVPTAWFESHEEVDRRNGDVDVYDSNIQTSETNMLGAALAIVEWKAVIGFYRSERGQEHDTTLFSTTTGRILSDKKGRNPG